MQKCLVWIWNCFERVCWQFLFFSTNGPAGATYATDQRSKIKDYKGVTTYVAFHLGAIESSGYVWLYMIHVGLSVVTRNTHTSSSSWSSTPALCFLRQSDYYRFFFFCFFCFVAATDWAVVGGAFSAHRSAPVQSWGKTRKFEIFIKLELFLQKKTKLEQCFIHEGRHCFSECFSLAVTIACGNEKPPYAFWCTG